MSIIGKLGDMEARAQDRPQTHGQLEIFQRVVAEHPEAIAVTVGDENTGIRFAKAAKRVGMCQKLGHNTYDYQAWATWAPADLAVANI